MITKISSFPESIKKWGRCLLLHKQTAYFDGTKIVYRCKECEDEMGKKWIQGAIKHPGALHKELGVPQGKKIPASKLKKAEHSKNPTIKKEANLAKTLKSFHKK